MDLVPDLSLVWAAVCVLPRKMRKNFYYSSQGSLHQPLPGSVTPANCERGIPRRGGGLGTVVPLGTVVEIFSGIPGRTQSAVCVGGDFHPKVIWYSTPAISKLETTDLGQQVTFGPFLFQKARDSGRIGRSIFICKLALLQVGCFMCWLSRTGSLEEPERYQSNLDCLFAQHDSVSPTFVLGGNAAKANLRPVGTANRFYCFATGLHSKTIFPFFHGQPWPFSGLIAEISGVIVWGTGCIWLGNNNNAVCLI